MRKPSSYILSMLAALAAAALGLQAAAPDFGPNVLIFDTSMSQASIQTAVDNIAAQQVSNQFGSQRYALLFKPGTYGTVANPLIFQVGYYTEVAGLGASPDDVVINGTINVFNQCLGASGTNCVALVNFWRSLSNLTINVAGGTGCRNVEFWAVARGASMRRVQVNGGFSLMDYCSAGPQFASGGFIADTKTTGGTIVNGSQEQFLVRNSNIDGWTNPVWNQVFSGVIGAPAQSFPNPPYTTLPTSPITRERPFLYVDLAGNWNVLVPAVQTDSSDITWGSGSTPGSSIPIANFLIATPATSASQITSALAHGGNVIFTPGVYQLTESIVVPHADAVLLGLGFATLSPQNGDAAMKVNGDKGVKIAGLLFDAGPVNSPVLLDLGTPNSHKSDPSDPTTLSDVFFRVGGAAIGKATNSLVVNSDNVILDNIWAWRADHGNPGTVGWTVNTADTGLVVDGDNVTAYGLFVEHYQQHEVIWNGENGRTIMFENEMPYDPPSQQAWMHDGILGFAPYKVAGSVKTHQGWGMISVCFFDQGVDIHAAHAFEVPVTAGVQFHDILTRFLSGSGGIDNVINNTGGAVSSAHPGPNNVVSYP